MAGEQNGARSQSVDEYGRRHGPIHEDEVRRRAHAIWEREGRPEGRQEDHWIQAKGEIEREAGEIEGDDLPSLDALREAAREHTDAFLIATDLEDADQREAAPGTREQP
ncbi:DUF2934 domain-containing protein [Rhizobium sp. SEMIA 4085]|uniref:DUF2934 domain-containing protein n=1 Tax=Rhizobium gallicum bv. gallicum R602sp TaxID=1041138 RepID=A0A0B4XCX4_9HYPH|nr:MULTISPECIES: DUF2934 domain-containing protein [Rhizobium]AJD44640.1 hypothetical protein RGR602_PC00601 [Rhizobium gallicum bv. gallicum R602sp]NNH30293.1 DUF2934 domain-containing protein [Rhizobium sp. SEMIA 4085]TDW33296.1 DUF2934 family protein [Rhizobium azibense]